jgi:oxygen-dependent protoporphyrinogen oxidase
MNITVTHLPEESEKGRFQINYESNGQLVEVATDSLIVATPSDDAAALLEPVSSDLSGYLKGIEYPPLATLCLSYDQSKIINPLKGFGFLATPVSKLFILGCLFSSGMFKGRAPEGNALLTIFIGGSRNPEAALVDQGRMVDSAHNELKRILGISCKPEVVTLTRYDRAIPQYLLGHRARVQSLEAELSKIPGLFIIGNYTHGVSTGDCIKEATRVAGSAIDFISNSD